MEDVPAVGRIQVAQDLRFQRRMWRAQRIGWALMLLTLAAGFAGAFGEGPLARGHAGDAAGPLRIDYERITRYLSPGQLRVSASARALAADTLTIWLDEEFLTGFRINHITPEPARVRSGDGRIAYSFLVTDPGARATVVFDVAPERPWLRRGRVGLERGAPLALTQFVWP
jgi:hypothetical protein